MDIYLQWVLSSKIKDLYTFFILQNLRSKVRYKRVFFEGIIELQGESRHEKKIYVMKWYNLESQPESQLITKCPFGVFNSSKKTNEKKFDLQYYHTLCQIVFICFFERIEDTKKHFEN